MSILLYRPVKINRTDIGSDRNIRSDENIRSDINSIAINTVNVKHKNQNNVERNLICP